jgi:Xaa-Pro aminopeptidase
MSLPLSSVLTARLNRVRAAFDEVGIDALVVSSLPNQRYLTNHVWHGRYRRAHARRVPSAGRCALRDGGFATARHRRRRARI